jgi:predicted RNase H-like HicB family nuclease
MEKISLKCAVWKEEKYYVAQCLNVDISSFGETRKKALKNLQEAMELYFEDENIPKVIKIERAEIVSRTLQYA